MLKHYDWLNIFLLVIIVNLSAEIIEIGNQENKERDKYFQKHININSNAPLVFNKSALKITFTSNVHVKLSAKI